MAAITGNPGIASLDSIIWKFVIAPVEHPQLLPILLPLILGAVVIELYFGKYSRESLGWNTSVGNAIIWVTTGVSLLLSSNLQTLERNAAYFLILVGSVVVYMDFYHKWPSTVAFMVSSAGIVYSLAYVTVVFVKTSLAINSASIKAAIVFIVAANILFKILQSLETPRDAFPR